MPQRETSFPIMVTFLQQPLRYLKEVVGGEGGWRGAVPFSMPPRSRTRSGSPELQ